MENYKTESESLIKSPGSEDDLIINLSERSNQESDGTPPNRESENIIDQTINNFPSDRLITVMDDLRKEEKTRSRAQEIAHNKNLTLNTSLTKNNLVRIGHESGENDVNEKDIENIT